MCQCALGWHIDTLWALVSGYASATDANVLVMSKQVNAGNNEAVFVAIHRIESGEVATNLQGAVKQKRFVLSISLSNVKTPANSEEMVFF